MTCPFLLDPSINLVTLVLHYCTIWWNGFVQ